MYGAFNVAVWSQTVDTLTTVAGSLNATLADGSKVVAGDPVSSVNVPAGTTIGSVAGNNIVLVLPFGAKAADIQAGVDAAATFGGGAWTGSVQLERTFDGGKTWLVCGVGGGGASAIYSSVNMGANPVSIVAAEPEKGVFYRLNCTALSAGSLQYRMSTSGLAAMAWGVPSA